MIQNEEGYFIINELLKGFNDNNFEIMLKYDGERIGSIYTDCIYTVVLVDLKDRTNNIRVDTKSCKDTTSILVQEESVDISIQAVKNFLDIFDRLTEELIKKYDEEIIFIFSLNNVNNFEYKVSLTFKRENINFSSKNFDDILNFLEVTKFL